MHRAAGALDADGLGKSGGNINEFASATDS